MSVLLDDLYLENIEEYVKDEKRIVTCKWLSRKLSVPMNAAKKMLYHYVSQQTTPNSLSVLYCVTGRKKNDESDKADIVVQLVTDDQLEDFERQLCEVWTTHVYSVQMSQIKESAILYSSDYQTLRDYCGEYNKWNPISCDIMSCDSGTPAAVPQREPTVPNVWSSETCKVLAEKSTNKGKETHLTNIKNNPKKVPANKTKQQQSSSSSKGSSFFSKNPSKSSDNGNSSASVKVNKPSTFIDQAKKEAEKNKDTKKLEAVAEDKIKIEKKSTYSGFHDSDFEDEGSSNEESLVQNKITDKKPTRNTKTTKSKTSKKSQQQPSSSTATDHNDTRETNKKKRRRVQELSSDEEDNLAIPEKSNELASSSTTEKNNTTRKRKVRRKLVSKTFLDEDGSMVTQKEWEEVSTDASSDGDDKTMAMAVGYKKQSNANIQSPNKRTKQSTLTSFFKK